MQWQKVLAVARFEFLSVVSRWSFWVVTLAMPLFVGSLVLGTGALQGAAFSKRTHAARAYAVVDHSALVAGMFAQQSDPNVRFVSLRSEAEAEQALRAERVAGVFVLPSDYLAAGRVRLLVLGTDPLEELSAKVAEERLGTLLRAELLANRLEPALSRRVLDPLSIERRTLSVSSVGHTEASDSDAQLARLLAPLLVALLLMLALLGTSSYLLQGLGVEKENKVIEVLLACARADEIFAGKLLGLGLAGFVQFAFWAIFLAGGVAAAALALASLGVEVPWLGLLAGLLFVPLGYFFIGSLMLTTGSLGSNTRESQQYAMIWASPVVLPMMLIGVLLSEPNGSLARFLSWFPFTSPVAMVLRLSLTNGQVGVWELFGSAAVLGLCTWLSVALGARLFRAGLLMSGSAFSFRAFFEKARIR
ncbi:MAG: ABC transporter permease [Polyangiaceae bacterium]|nr:ABC transporter permease [Polyangiaceae bacterium]